MTESKIYISLAQRFLTGGSAAIAQSHELVGFTCYHAFESAGGAYATSRGKDYPRRHASKLNVSVAFCNNRRFRHSVSALAIHLGALRNQFLYPIQTGSGWLHPMVQISRADVEKLHRRVSGIVRVIEREIP